MTRVAILGSGDELIRGRSRDTNFAQIAARLTEEGHEVVGGRLVGDDGPALLAALRGLAAGADAVVSTGGLGPTADDLMRAAAARALRVPLVEHRPSAARIRARWRRAGLPLPESNLLQALLPRGAKAIRNDFGTAPGMRFRLRGAEVFCLPGPPREMAPMLEREVVPALRRLAGRGPRVRSVHLSCFGMPESLVAERLGDLMDRRRAVKVGTVAAAGVITLAVHGTGDAAAEVPRVAREARRRIGAAVYATGRVSPGENLVRLLVRRGLTVAAAESCTAGLVAARLTDLPGSSKAFLGGVVAYHDGFKARALGVPSALLRRHGAVSGEVAEAMARGIRGQTGADLAVAVTGIAGPGGARRGKPVGLVWFAVASRGGTRSGSRRLPGDRAFVRSLAADTAIDLLRRTVEGLPGLDSNQE